MQASRLQCSASSLLLGLLLLAAGPAVLRAQLTLASAIGTGTDAPLGEVLLAVPDQDGDGIEDLAVGLPAARDPGGAFGAGRVELRSGANPATVLWRWPLQGAGPNLGARIGSALSLLDADGDGSSELAVGAPLDGTGSTLGPGRVHLLELADGSPAGPALVGLQIGERFGSALVNVGDRDGDGREDLVIGSPLWRPAPTGSGPPPLRVGRATLHRLSDGAEVRRWTGSSRDQRFGSTLADAGDLDFDRDSEIAVGAPGTLGGAGRVHLIDPDGPVLVARDGLPGEAFGSAIVSVGDVDGDRIPDLAVGGPRFDAGSLLRAGRVSLRSGLDLAPLGAPLIGTEAGANLGAALALLADADGNGRPELLAAEPRFDGAGFDVGRVLVLEANDLSLPALAIREGPGDSAFFGTSISAGLDLEADGRPDFAIGGPGAFGDRGTVETHSLGGLGDAVATTWPAPRDAFALSASDADGDGDLEILLLALAPPRVEILWNGTHAPGVALGDFGALPTTVLSLPAQVQPTAFVALDFADGDPTAEILVGDAQGSLWLFDGLGSSAAPSFAPAVAGPTLPDASSRGAVRAMASWPGSGAPRIAVARQGSLLVGGSVDIIKDPAGTVTGLPGVSTIASAGAYVSLHVVDLDGDGALDLLWADERPGAAGAEIVLARGPSATSLSIQSAGLSRAPVALTSAALDPDGLRDDLIVGDTGLLGGGAGVVPDFRAAGSFGSEVSLSSGPASALSVVSWRPNGAADGATVLDAAGVLHQFSDWNGSAFAAVERRRVASRALAAMSAEWDPRGALGPELAVLAPSDGRVILLRPGVVGSVTRLPGTGCGPTGPQISWSGRPTVDETDFNLILTPPAGLVQPAYYGLVVLFFPRPGVDLLPVPASQPCSLLFRSSIGEGPGFETQLVPTLGARAFPMPASGPLNLGPLALSGLAYVDVGVQFYIEGSGLPILGTFALTEAISIRVGDRAP